MGETLSPEVLRAFGTELQKQADFRTNLYEFAGRIGNPIKGITKGWKMMAPTELLKTQLPAAKHLGQEMGEWFAPQRAGMWAGLKRSIGNQFRSGLHLQEASTPVLGGGARQAAEELSRRGWTGQGRLTKYTPLGEKSMAALGGAVTAGETAHALANRGEGGPGPAEKALGGLGALGTGVMTFGTGGLGLAAPLIAGHYAGRGGRVIDRLMQRKEQT